MLIQIYWFLIANAPFAPFYGQGSLAGWLLLFTEASEIENFFFREDFLCFFPSLSFGLDEL
jgi:hypothetical protein